MIVVCDRVRNNTVGFATKGRLLQARVNRWLANPWLAEPLG